MIEVTMSEIEDELLEGSIHATAGNQDPGSNPGDSGYGGGYSKGNYFGFDNFAEYYDNDDYDDDDYYEF